MKLSNLTAKLTCMKGTAIRALAASALAGAVLTAAAPAAQAQRFAIGVQFGGPRYYAPPPPVPRVYGYGYEYDRGYYSAYAPPYGYGYGDWRTRNYVRHEEFDRYHHERDHFRRY